MSRQLNDGVKVFGLFGFPLSHTLSPLMQNAALRSLGIPGIYLPFERNKKQFLKLIRARRKMILDGFNLTVPYKETVLPYVDQLDRSVKMTGAVNTVKRTGKRWVGYNTDLDGFVSSLREAGFQAKGKKVVLIGAGGAARAVLASLLQLGAKEIVVFNRTQSKSKSLVKEFQTKTKKTEIRHAGQLADLHFKIEQADLLVNATSLGLKPADPSPIPMALLKQKKKMLVYDLIYGKKMTKFLKFAKRFGHRTMDGEAMLLHQGVRAFEIWTGKQAPIHIMRKALRDGLLVR